MAAPLFLRGVPLLRLRLHQHRCSAVAILTPRPQSAVPEPSTTNPDEHKSCSSQSTATLSAKDPPKYPRLTDLQYRKWKDKEDEILRDVGPVILLTKDILHSDRSICCYGLLYISWIKGPLNLSSVKVDRHPQFICSRCLFVVRIDGGWIDFSYQKCLRAYVRFRYPLHADKFIRKHFKR
ncbi:hypothetical protein RHGRI_016298 [Rhododendron griersonianum]|uniref:Uncharacterized protein n=1 Tax=Rhododendron griersonianum TaxID=479676 RepID=A0AAV6JTN5_9ERIC|nr:hypothetical protein RHGRI_016298 [Rhododendron griersonianum]